MLPRHILDKIHEAAITAKDYYDFAEEIHTYLDEHDCDPCAYADRLETVYRRLYVGGYETSRAQQIAEKWMRLYVLHGTTR